MPSADASSTMSTQAFPPPAAGGLRKPVAASVAVIAMWLLLIAGVVVKVAFPGWMLAMALLGSPVLLGVPLAGACFLTSALVGARRAARTRPWALAAAWVLGIAIFATGAVVPDVDDAGPERSLVITAVGGQVQDWMLLGAVLAWLVAALASIVGLVVWSSAEHVGKKRAVSPFRRRGRATVVKR
ncbi:hypothetical protein [Cellulomonas sp. URHB0016]